MRNQEWSPTCTRVPGAGDLAVVAPDPVQKAVNRHAVSRLLIFRG